jgi:DNA-binding beta-propeller fold protein YncE
VGLLAIAALSLSQEWRLAGQTKGSVKMPVFEVDPSWPKLPNEWGLGQTPSVAVDKHDHVWILHRPRTIEGGKTPAPAVVELDATGKFVKSWGGPGQGFDWPDSEHGITIDYKDNVWVGGSSPTSTSLTQRSDDMLLKFTSKGKFLLQLGSYDKSGGNADTKSVKRAADAFVYAKANEVFVADGYGNRRVIVFDADTGAFKRQWGAFGNVAVDLPAPAAGKGAVKGAAPGAAKGPAPAAGKGAAKALETEGPGPDQFGSPVHNVKISNDGLVYVADRANRRIQIFDVQGKYIDQIFINRAGPSSGSAAGIAFSPDAAQQFMYVADYGNSRVLVLNRKSRSVLYQFGLRNAEPGNFQGIHFIAVDSKGNLYTAEVLPGNRVQKFLYRGLVSAPPKNALTAEQLANATAPR